MSKKGIREILCENCKMNCKLLANNVLVFGCFFNHNTNKGLQKAFESYESQYKAEVEKLNNVIKNETRMRLYYVEKCTDYLKENESLKKKLEKAEDVIKFYGDPEKWMIKTSDSWTKSNPRTYGDSELIENYKHPNKDWIGSIVVGGKRARAYLKENEG